MFKREFVLIGHGSRDPEAVAAFHTFEQHLSGAIKQPLASCFLELTAPDVLTGLADAARRAGAGGEIILQPVFLGAALHVKTEIPELVHEAAHAHPEVTFKLGLPLGFHAALAEIVAERVQIAVADDSGALPPEDTAVLIVGGGSSDADSNSSVARLARVVEERLRETTAFRAVEVAYQRVTRPTTANGIRKAVLLGAKQVIVAPYLLFTGEVHQRLRAAAERQAAVSDIRVIHADVLGPDHPALLGVAAQRLRETVEGTTAVLRAAAPDGFVPEIVDKHGHHHHDHEHHHEHRG